MPAYIIRWPDGDVSIVVAATKVEALVQLDQIDSPDAAQLHRLHHCSLHFKPIDNGQSYVLSLEFEETAEEAMAFFYPGLEAEIDAEIEADAQERERRRLRLLPPPARPRTEP